MARYPLIGRRRFLAIAGGRHPLGRLLERRRLVVIETTRSPVPHDDDPSDRLQRLHPRLFPGHLIPVETPNLASASPRLLVPRPQ